MRVSLPTVSVIVPTYKSWASLAKCVEALKKQSYPAALVEIIVVNNLPEDIPPFPANEFKILSESTPGSYAARNKGISEATGEIIAFTDADCIPDPDWLSEGIKTIIEKNADRVAGNIRVTFTDKDLSAIEAYQKALSFNQKRLAKNGLSVTANLLCTRKSIEVTGTFDTELLSGGDWEWNRRANRAGLSLLYSEKAIVNHPARSSWADMLKKSRRVNSSLVRQKSLLKSIVKIIIHFFNGFMPPLKRGLEIFENENLTWKEKLKSWMVCYLLKVYGHSIRVLAFFKIIKPIRD